MLSRSGLGILKQLVLLYSGPTPTSLRWFGVDKRSIPWPKLHASPGQQFYLKCHH